jgi:hypothetical protein
MIETLDGAKVADFEYIGDMLFRETALLKAWRKSNKVLPQKRE